jgi:hypothetical protein
VQFISLQGRAYAVAAWLDAPQHRACVPRSGTRALERCRASCALKPTAFFSLLFAGPKCSGVCACEGGERTPCLFVCHPSQPRIQAGRVTAAGRHAGVGARRVPGSRAAAGVYPLATDLNLAVGPHVAIRPNGIQLRPSVPDGSWSRIQGGSVDFGPLDQLGRAHWATFDPVALCGYGVPRAFMEPLLYVFFLFDSVLMDLYPACSEEMYSD